MRETEGRAGGGPSKARVKALETMYECAWRLGERDGIGEGRIRATWDVVSGTVRREGSNAVKAAGLRVMLALARWSARYLGAETVWAHGRALRRDFERTTKNSKTVRGLILRVIGAAHVGMKLQGLTLDVLGEKVAAEAPTAEWLLKASCRVLDAALDDEDTLKKEIILIASALDALTSALTAHGQENDQLNNACVVRIVTRAVAYRVAGQRHDMTRSALELISEHVRTLRYEFVKVAPEVFQILLNLRVSKTSDVARLAGEAYEKFVLAMSDAFDSDASPSREARTKLLEKIMESIIHILDDDSASHRDRTACIRALGKFAVPALELGVRGADMNAYLGRLERLSMYTTFRQGHNEFQGRFESIERQVSLLSAYSDLLRKREIMVDEALIVTVGDLVEWLWEHYAFEHSRRKPLIQNALWNLFVALSSKGCALQTLLTRIGAKLLGLTLRVSPPDPVDKALYRASPVPMWPRYVELWTTLLGRVDDTVSRYSELSDRDIQIATAAVYGSFVSELLNFCITLNLGIVTSTGLSTSLQQDDEVDAVAVAVSLGDEANASNPGDMQTFLQLVEFSQRVIDESPPDSLLPWVDHLSDELMRMANQNSSLSGFYKLIGAIVSAANRGGYFSNLKSAESERVLSLFQSFLRDVLQDTRRFSGELLAAVLRLLLSLPSVILPMADLISPLLRALELGLQYPGMPITGVALDTLERWIDGKHVTNVSQYLPQIAKRLCAYLDSAAKSDSLFSSNETEDEKRSIVIWGGGKKRKQLAGKTEEQEDVVLKRATLIRIAKIIGAMGGAGHGLLEDMKPSKLDLPWDRNCKLPTPIGLVRSSTNLWLDSLLPRASHLALFSQDRSTKVHACEALYGFSVFLIGKSAHAPSHESGDFSRTESQYRPIFEKLFPIIFELAVDTEPVARQLFNSLSFQKVRWYAKNQARELDVTICLFDAVLTGLSNSSKAGAVRDLCASLTAELLDWSLRYVRDDKTFEGSVNHRFILHALFGLIGHSSAEHRLGAVTAIRRCLKHIAKNQFLIDEYVLKMLDVTLKSMSRSDEHAAGSSMRGADVAMAVLIQEILHIIQANANRLLSSPGSKATESIELFLQRTLELTMSSDEFTRREAQKVFDVIAPISVSDTSEWFQARSHLVSSSIDALVPEMSAVEYSERATIQFIAVIQWSNWMIRMRHAGGEFFPATRTMHFRAAGLFIERTAQNVEISREKNAVQNQHLYVTREIFALLDTILKSALRGAEKDALLALILDQEYGYVNACKVMSAAIFFPQNLGNDQEASKKSITRAAIQLLKTISVDNGSSKAKRLYEDAVANLQQMVSIPKFNLSEVDLSSTQGCIAAQRLVDGYTGLASVSMLRRVLMREGNTSAKVLAEVALSRVCGLGHNANPPQRVVGQAIVKLCLHLNIAPNVLLDFLLDRRGPNSGKQLGEALYRNYRESFIRTCEFQFDDYATDLLITTSADVTSAGGRVATDIILGVVDRATSTLQCGGRMSLNGVGIRNAIEKNISHLRHLYEDHDSATAEVRNTCHQRFLTIIRKVMTLDANLRIDESIASNDTIVSGLMRCVRNDCIALSSHVDAITITCDVLQDHRILRAQKDALEKSLGDSLKNMMVQERCDAITFQRRFPSTINAFKQAFAMCRSFRLISALVPFYDKWLEPCVKGTVTSWNGALAQSIWLIVADVYADFRTQSLAASTILPTLLEAANAQEIVEFFMENHETIMKDVGGANGLLCTLRSLNVLLSVYQKCDKQQIIDGPCSKVPKLNALVSKSLMFELSGLGVAGKAQCGQENIALRVYHLAFLVFSCLLAKTQTHVKFYLKLFESTKSWNNLVDRTKRIELEAEAINEVPDSAEDISLKSPTKDVSFTLSSTLAAMYSTLKTESCVTSDVIDDDWGKETEIPAKGQPRDVLEAHPVSDGVFRILELVTKEGLTGGNSEELPPSIQLLEAISSLLYTPMILPAVKLFVVKALLRLNHELASDSDSDISMHSVCTSPSLLAANPDVMLSLLTATIELVKESGVDNVSTPLRETLDVALECTDLWNSKFDEAKPCLLDAIEIVLKCGHSKYVGVMKANLALLTRMFARLRDAVLSIGTPPAHCFQNAFHRANEILELVPKSKSQEEKKFVTQKKLFVMQLIATLIHEETKVIQVNDEFVFITNSRGEQIGDGIRSPLIQAVMSCLMSSTQSTGGLLNSVASALLGKIMEIDGNHPRRWHDYLRKRCQSLYDAQAWDPFLDTLDRVTKRCPNFPHDTGLAPLVHSVIDKVYGEKKCLALMIVTRSEDEEVVRSTYERLLPFVTHLVRQKDEQLLEVLFAALTRGVKVATIESSHLKQWHSALIEADSAVDTESVVNVREAHTKMCIAVAEAFPELVNEASLRGPLLQALADPVSTTCRDSALAFWNTRLQYDNLFARLQDVLKLIPNKKVESLWLAAACRLMFAVQQMNLASGASLIDSDLSDCVFTLVKVDTLRRRGASQTMNPLFSSESTQLQKEGVDALKQSVLLAHSQQLDADPLFAATLSYKPVKRLPKSAYRAKDVSSTLHKTSFSAVIPKFQDAQDVQKTLGDVLLDIDGLKQDIKLTRSYRTGELPDVKISRNELILPFLVTAERDSVLACALLREFSSVAMEEFEFISKNQHGGDLHADHKGGDLRADKKTVGGIARALKGFISKIEGGDASVVRFALSLCEFIPKATDIPISDIVRLARRGESLASGVVALESILISSEKDGSSETWEALATLCKSIGYDDNALLSFVNAFPNQSDTMVAIREEMTGNLQNSANIYKNLLHNVDDDQSPREREFWTHEYFRCAERLGDWDEIGEMLADVRSGNFEADIAVADCGIAGEASGGSRFSTAFRVAIRQPLVDWSAFFANIFANGESALRWHRSVGVELSLHELTNNRREQARNALEHVFEGFLEAWSATCASSIAIRRKILQALQPAVEISETLRAMEEINDILCLSSTGSNIDRANTIVSDLDSIWRSRWPSAVHDPSEAWERVVTFRSRMMSTIVGVIPEIETTSIEALRTGMWLCASDGLRQVGQVALSRKFLRQYIESVQRTEASESWKLYEALFNLKLATGTSNSIEKALEMCRIQLHEEKWQGDDHINCSLLEARMCEHLASAGGDDSITYGIAAIENFTAIAETGKNVEHAVDASLRLAHFCDAALKKLHGDYAQASISSNCAEALEVWLAENHSSLSQVFIRHTLKSLEMYGTQQSLPARHLLPRLLVLLRDHMSPQTAQEYSQTLLRVPSWLFLDWIPHLLSMVSDTQLHAVTSPLTRRLLSKYPAAVRPHFNLMKETMNRDISERISFALASSLHDGFTRAIELLHFPANRLSFWRQQLYLRECQHDKCSCNDLIEVMLLDLAVVDDPLLGPINKRFVEIASPILNSVVKSALKEKMSVSETLKKVEVQVLDEWRKEFHDIENSARLRLSDFSSWFELMHSSSEQVLEVPGQYDNIIAPPDASKHVTVMGFAPDVQIFASKQRPKKIIMRGSDGQDYAFIAKGGEDLRQDERIQQLFRAMNGMLASFTESRGRRMEVRTFHVAPLTPRTGLIEFLRNTSPLLRLLSKPVTGMDIDPFKEHQRWIREHARGIGKRKRDIAQGEMTTTHEDYLAAINKASRKESETILSRLRSSSHSNSALRNILLECAGNAEAFLMMRQAFAASLSSSSICGYVAGVGDRHLDNILLDLSTGQLVHIDFGYAFGTATSALPIPELVPFRATPALLDVLAPMSARTWLETDMARTVKALQNGSTLLKGVMDIFLREPLIDWEREALVASRSSKSSHIQSRITHAWGKLELDNPAKLVLEQCVPRHQDRSYWTNMCEALVGSNAEPTSKCATVEEQVRALIDLATNPELLAVAWSGWRPWL